MVSPPDAQMPDHRSTGQSSHHACVEHGSRAVRVQKSHTHISNETTEVYKASEHSRTRTTETRQWNDMRRKTKGATASRH